MATIKAYTDPSQSKTLSKILPLKSADGGWYGTDNPLAANTEYWLYTKYTEKAALPAWSLAALLGIIRQTIGYTLYGVNNVYMSCDLGDKPWKIETEVYDNPVDACYEMILKLHELKML